MAPPRKKAKLATESVDPASGFSAETTTATQNSDAQQRRSLFIRSLPATTTTQTLTDLFSESYPIKHATAVIDPATKQCRGYGFVTFADAEDAQRAREEFNGHTLDGRKIRIEIAEPRQRDAEKAASTAVGTKATPFKQSDEPQPSRLIVRNLPWTIKTTDQLSKLFLSYGKVKSAHLPKNKHGLLAGFGFVVVRGRKNAEKALEGVNGREVDGRTLAVDWAVNKDVYENLVNQTEQSTADGVEDGGAAEAIVDEQDDADLEDDAEGDQESDNEELSSIDEDEDAESDVEIQVDGKVVGAPNGTSDTSSTLFVRNLPFTCTDEDLEERFETFGKVRYARIVMDPITERSKGTGFVCFYNKLESDACLRNAPRTAAHPSDDAKDAKARLPSSSILQNEDSDPSGNYTMDGRVLQISRAVDKSEANRLTQEGAASRRKRNEDKRRLYLLSEGTISARSQLWQSLSTTEQNMREASAKQRRTLIESNPSLHLSLTRLSVRNIPRSVTSKDLKSLAREAVVGFATDVKAGAREKLSKEELARGGADMEDAEKARKRTGKGVVKQAKVVFEGAGGGKVEESSGAGKSRGYGFIEYHTHRCALMGLRWLNGHSVGYQVQEQHKKSKVTKDEIQDRKKRLIVEFAIENAQVVLRRNDREQKARDRSQAVENGDVAAGQVGDVHAGEADRTGSLKRKRTVGNRSQRLRPSTEPRPKPSNNVAAKKPTKAAIDEKTAKRNRIIGRKRAMRRARKG